MADFWAGYLSGIAGIIIGSPLDIIKTRSQSRLTPPSGNWYERPTSLIRGAAAPLLGYGALNALLFFSYNQSLAAMGESPSAPGNLWKIWLGGAIGGLACFVVSTPTELVKCRAQVRNQLSWDIARSLYRTHGLRGFYIGGTVTSLRDSIGYGFYFWAYEGSKRFFPTDASPLPSWTPTINTLVCGGIAGCVTWASVYPLDVIKTLVQVQSSIIPEGEPHRPLLEHRKTLGAWECTKRAYRQGGFGAFWGGIWVCLGRAFIVNAVTFFTYEWAMSQLVQEGVQAREMA